MIRCNLESVSAMGNEREASGRAQRPRDGDATKGDPIFGPLKRLYEDVANEPLPDDLIDLLEQLDRAEKNR